jgi:Calcium-dependent channel, 7TM region, putative phosphate/Late exocytosis, associated with Golgi transport
MSEVNATTQRDILETFDANLLTSFTFNIILSAVLFILLLVCLRFFPHIYAKRSYIGAKAIDDRTRRRRRLARKLGDGGKTDDADAAADDKKADKKKDSSDSDSSDSDSDSDSDEDDDAVVDVNNGSDDAPFPPLYEHSFVPRWVVDMWLNVKEEDLIEHHGLDLPVYLMCIRTLAKLTLYMMVPGIIVGIANALGMRHTEDDSPIVGTAIISLSNIGEGSWLLLVHTVAMLSTNFLCYRELIQLYKRFQDLRQEWRLLPGNRVSSQTVMFTGVPLKHAKDSASAMKFLRQVHDTILPPGHHEHAVPHVDLKKGDKSAFANLASSQVQAAILPMNLNDVSSLQAERQKKALALEKAIVADAAALKEYQEKYDAGEEVEKPEPVQCNVGLPLISKKAPAQRFLSAELRRIDREIQAILRKVLPDDTVDELFAENEEIRCAAPKVTSSGGKKNATKKEAKKKNDSDDSDASTEQDSSASSSSDDSPSDSDSDDGESGQASDDDDDEIYSWENSDDDDDDDDVVLDDAARLKKCHSRGTGVVFASYSTSAMANFVGQSAIAVNHRSWKARAATEPESVMWENLHFAASHQKAVRMWAGRVIIILLIVFWMVPVGLVSAVSNMATLKSVEWLGWLVAIIEFNPVISGIVSGILPQLALIVFMALLLPIIGAIVYKLQGRTTRASGEAAVFQYYFAFQVVNVFLGSIIAGSAFSLLESATDLNAIISTLADALPPLVGFFISYVMLLGLTGKFIAGLNIGPLVMHFLKGKFLGKTERDFEELRLPVHFMMPKELSISVLVFVICLTYSIIAPLILPFGLVAQGVYYTLKKRDLYYGGAQSWDTGGALFVPFFKSMMFGLLIYQLVLTGVFSLKQFPVGSAVALISALLTFILLLRLPQKYDRGVRYGSLLGVVGQESIHNRLLLQDAYVHPATCTPADLMINPVRTFAHVDELKESCFEAEKHFVAGELIAEKLQQSVDAISVRAVHARVVED